MRPDTHLESQSADARERPRVKHAWGEVSLSPEGKEVRATNISHTYSDGVSIRTQRESSIFPTEQAAARYYADRYLKVTAFYSDGSVEEFKPVMNDDGRTYTIESRCFAAMARDRARGEAA